MPKTLGLLERRCAAIVIAFLLAPFPTAAEEESQLRSELIALDQAYVSEWLEGDSEGVLSLFTADATLVPHHGDTPIKAKTSIRQFWFNPSYPPTSVVAWERVPVETVILGNIGIVRGRSTLTWMSATARTTIPISNYVMIAVRVDEQWKIRMLTWNDDPRDWIVEDVPVD